MTAELPEYVDGLPNVAGQEAMLQVAIAEAAEKEVFRPESRIDFAHIRAACAIALHMHQPLIPAGGADLRTAAIISNLQYMLENPHIGDNHNATPFIHCYERIGRFVPQMIEDGLEPRVMLEYSGTLLHGLRQMGLDHVFAALKRVTCDPRYRRGVEWLGCPWGHPVAPSTPVQDYRWHVRAWQHHFAAIFGVEALQRVRGFSPSEMALPNHPDVAFAFVETLRACGYQWVLVQEHTVEQPVTGHPPERKHLPHRLVATGSDGRTAEIVALIKTQGSDTKLVAQMQPFYEAKSLSRHELAGRPVPPLVTQIADGENGGVMMNEFPGKLFQTVREASGADVVFMNGTEYLEHLFAQGIRPSDLPAIQPIHQKAIWEKMRPGDGAARLAAAIEACKAEDHRFHMEGGSWTNDISWVRGYDSLLGPMERMSVEFDKVISRQPLATDERRFRNALFHVMAAETSCYRYWGQGLWVDYGKEICRRAEEIVKHDYGV